MTANGTPSVDGSMSADEARGADQALEAGQGWPWPVGAATGVGSLPGTSVVEAVRTIFGELPDLPYLPELPDRGPAAGMIGRSAGLLVGMPVDLYVGRWRTATRAGIDARRIADLLERDLDALTDAADGFTGLIKVAAAGPWTLAAGLDLPVGGPLLHDHGAARDLTASLAEGLAAHVAEVSRRVPGARVLLQLDEPSLPAVLAGRVPTESGFATLRAVAAETARSALREVVDAVGVPVAVHCCAPDAPIGLLREAGAVAVSLDLSLLGDLDPVGEALDAGMGLFAGAVPTSGGSPSGKAAADAVLDVWNKLGFPLRQLPEQVVVTPACGLAGASPAYARAATTATREAARRLVDAALG
jgi:Cobalamin-independent synthase, Catalytic domain